MESGLKSLENKMDRRFAELTEIMVQSFHFVYERLDKMDQKFEGKIDGLGKRMDGLDKRMDGLEKRMDGLEKRMDGFDSGMERFDERMEQFDKRMDGFDKRLEGFDSRLNSVNMRLDTVILDTPRRMEHNKLVRRVIALEGRR